MIAVVMYRNPLEEWFWQSGAAWIFYGMIALFLLLVIADQILSGRKKK